MMQDIVEQDLQLSMMEAWQEKGQQELAIIKAATQAPALVKPYAHDGALSMFRYYGMQYQYWQMFGHSKADAIIMARGGE